MADKKISQLPGATTPLTGAEELAIVQSGVTKKATIEDVKGYKVYTALLAQNGGDGPSTTAGDESLGKGTTYTIVSLEAGDNLIPYGAPNNEVGTSFVCNQDTGIWGNPLSTLSFNNGAPVVTVLENTIGNIWWTYDGVGVYGANTDGLFTDLQTFVLNGPLNNVNTNGFQVLFEANYPNMLQINLYDTSFSNTNGIGDNLAVEIRVYN